MKKHCSGGVLVPMAIARGGMAGTGAVVGAVHAIWTSTAKIDGAILAGVPTGRAQPGNLRRLRPPQHLVQQAEHRGAKRELQDLECSLEFDVRR